VAVSVAGVKLDCHVWSASSEGRISACSPTLLVLPLQEFDKEEALRMVGNAPGLLAMDVIVWRQALAVWRLCGVSDPLAVVRNNPQMLIVDWLNPSRAG
jgi:hypothetical protein